MNEIDLQMFAENVRLLILGGYISKKDVISMIRKGTSNMLNVSEDEIFTPIERLE